MEFLALLTLNILLLASFIESTSNGNKNYLLKAKKQNLQTQTHTKASDSINQNKVLGSYVISFDAVTKNQSESNQEVSKSNNTSYNLVTDAVPTPSITDELQENEKENIDNSDLISPDNATFLMNKINSYRQKSGLSSFSYDNTVCNFAKTRVQELKADFSHTGFRERINSNTLPYPDYTHIAENIADTETAEKAFELWRNSSGHNENMLSTATYGCIGNIGRLYTLEIWEP